MGFYQYRREQLIKQPMETVWDFISSPKNLKEITPDYMGFDITSIGLPEKMYAGMIISYQVTPISGYKTTWVTEITHVEEGKYFVDEQRVGPYKMWHHEHILQPRDNDTLMIDIISYQPPLGILGDIANKFVIRSKIAEIFDYREQVLDRLFNSNEK
ncbi:hypothetical protein EMN47_18885 [Prolixibacteraceae bacterium JC049]|nr:hypothetical protein [Prolixibacteraceae bacterium JC049]